MSNENPAGWSGAERDDIAAAQADELAELIPSVQVVRGAPDDDELAALMGGFLSAAADDREVPDATQPPSGVWTSRCHQLRTRPAPGPDAWRWSAHK